MGAGAVILGLVFLLVIVFLSVVLYKMNQCRNKDGSASNVASYSFSFPFSCTANACVSGFTLDSTGNCVPSTSNWTSDTTIQGLPLGASFPGSSLDDCQQKCLANSKCDAAILDPTNKCILRSSDSSYGPFCLMGLQGYQVFQKPGGAVPSKC